MNIEILKIKNHIIESRILFSEGQLYMKYDSEKNLGLLTDRRNCFLLTVSDLGILLSFNVNTPPDSAAKLTALLIQKWPNMKIDESYYFKNGEVVFGPEAHAIHLYDTISYGKILERSLN